MVQQKGYNCFLDFAKDRMYMINTIKLEEILEFLIKLTNVNNE